MQHKRLFFHSFRPMTKTEIIQGLQGKNAQLERENRLKEDKIQELKFQLEEYKRLVHGPRSERHVSSEIAEQLLLDLTAETSGKPVKQPEEEIITYKPKKPASKPNRQPLPDHLPRVEHIVEPDEDVSGLKCIGEEVSELLAKQPSRLFVIRIIRKKYAKADGSGVIIGSMPSRSIQKGMAHESLLADMLVSKYADHLPLYRQAKILSREGVTIASSTMSDWVSSCCKLLAPLYEALKQEVLRTAYLQVDESPIKVLDKTKKGSTHRGYYWLYHDVDGGLVCFDYQKGRGRDGPAHMLKGYQGYLQTDGYGVYDKFENVEGITMLGCMAHARRYFEKAKENDPERANHFLTQVQSLYLLEQQMKEKQLDWDRKAALRQSVAIPVLQNLQQWLTVEQQKVLPKSAIGKAIAYSRGQWNRLIRYTESGGLMIDNNLIENQIRPLAMGRKNYLFAGSHQGARNSAIIYSLIGSCVRNNIDPFQYLYAILTKLPDYPINKISDLLPCNVSFEKPAQ